jgi:GGDEF domain-containing protein
MTADRPDILSKLEQQALANALRCHRLTDPRDHSSVGLVVLQNDVDAGILKNSLADLAGPSLVATSLSGKISLSKTGSLSRNIVELLQVEQARVAKTRLPCALLLVELDDFAELPQSDAAMDHLLSVCLDNLEEIDILSVYERGKIAIIMPGINRRLAAKRAEAIRQAAIDRPLEEGDGFRPISVSIALSLYQASDQDSAATLLYKTTRHLTERGADKNCLLYIDTGVDKEDNLQVSVEERLQLFSILDQD